MLGLLGRTAAARCHHPKGADLLKCLEFLQLGGTLLRLLYGYQFLSKHKVVSTDAGVKLNWTIWLR